jgi:hypothetical protein
MHGGVRVAAALDPGPWTIGLEGGFLFPGAQSSTAGTVTAYAVYGSIVPCLRPSMTPALSLDLCAVGRVGVLRSDASGVDVSQPATDILATAGPRAGFTLLPLTSFGFAASAEVPFSLSRNHLVIDDRGRDQTVWTESRAGLAIDLSLVWRTR